MGWKNARGEPLVKQVAVRVILPEGHPEQRRVFRPAEPRCGYNPSQVEELVGEVIDWLDKTYPYWEFRMVRVGAKGDAINFVYAGLRERRDPVVIDPSTSKEAPGAR